MHVPDNRGDGAAVDQEPADRQNERMQNGRKIDQLVRAATSNGHADWQKGDDVEWSERCSPVSMDAAMYSVFAQANEVCVVLCGKLLYEYRHLWYDSHQMSTHKNVLECV